MLGQQEHRRQRWISPSRPDCLHSDRLCAFHLHLARIHAAILAEGGGHCRSPLIVCISQPIIFREAHQKCCMPKQERTSSASQGQVHRVINLRIHEVFTPASGFYEIKPQSCYRFEQALYEFDTQNPKPISIVATVRLSSKSASSSSNVVL